jgi:hypothetical protein
MEMSRRVEQTSFMTVIFAWIVVSIPLAWGVYQTLVKSRPLLHRSSATATATVQTTSP